MEHRQAEQAGRRVPPEVVDVVGRMAGLVPGQARAVGVVARTYRPAELETRGQRETADAAARTAVAEEIEERWPGAPYVVRHGPAEDFPGAVPQAAHGDEVVIGIVYRVGWPSAGE
ncbi:hypothetical protein [Nocardiopsis suaedae]|uniref:Uncharacterized protein n=1 Tax=Nocardiopsis suaedae TaxID=3018444 RepID=A0ABT4TLD9_9ACTN|nr:hypothetical protein [Nocardiopsis suaedae]MDA2805517.1 hypothetical protein [Nocardiopsis suaedae]